MKFLFFFLFYANAFACFEGAIEAEIALSSARKTFERHYGHKRGGAYSVNRFHIPENGVLKNDQLYIYTVRDVSDLGDWYVAEVPTKGKLRFLSRQYLWARTYTELNTVLDILKPYGYELSIPLEIHAETRAPTDDVFGAGAFGEDGILGVYYMRDDQSPYIKLSFPSQEIVKTIVGDYINPALDPTAVIHEFIHAIQFEIIKRNPHYVSAIGMPFYNQNRHTNFRGLLEGFADFFAATFTERRIIGEIHFRNFPETRRNLNQQFTYQDGVEILTSERPVPEHMRGHYLASRWFKIYDRLKRQGMSEVEIIGKFLRVQDAIFTSVSKDPTHKEILEFFQDEFGESVFPRI